MLILDFNVLTLNFLLSAVAGTVVGIVVGAIWYSPMAFQKQWLEALGKTADDVKPEPMKFLLNAIAIFIGALVITWILSVTGADLVDSIIIGVALWAFILMAAYGGVAFENYPVEAFYINTVFTLVYVVLMSVTIKFVGDLNLVM